MYRVALHIAGCSRLLSDEVRRGRIDGQEREEPITDIRRLPNPMNLLEESA
jgi:hypothetical protein